MEDVKIAENIANIGMTAGIMLKEGAIQVEDSTELTMTIVQLGSRFETEFGEIVEKEENYIEMIDNFAEKELLKAFAPHDLIAKFLSVKTTLSDKSMSHARFFLSDDSHIEPLEDQLVALPEKLKTACIKMLEQEGYEYVDSFNYYEDHILTVEVQKKS